MKVESVIQWGGWLTGLLAIAVCLGIATLLGFGYRATREWQRSSQMLVARDMEESADLLVTAVTRDMRGAHSRVLANRDWGELSLESFADTSDQVATAFARYPYPESFFSWARSNPDHVVFFARSNRFPEWMPHASQEHHFPVVLVTNPPGAGALRQQVERFTTGRFRYATFEMSLGGLPYQVVARLDYADSLQEQLDSVTGFTVNLEWVRESYFSDILSQVAPIATRGNTLSIAVFDDKGQQVWGREGRGALVREFPLLFLDPSVSRVALGANPPVRTWRIQTSQSSDSALLGAAQGADEALLAAAAAALTLALGLILAIRAVRAGVALTAMRSDFVSSVTHELKTPLANIRAMADTLARRPIGGETVRDYAELLMQEARRLTRLVDNLLAYARVTDVTEIYSFEQIAPAELIDDVIQNFHHPLAERGFKVEVETPVDLPLVKADRTAMMLAFDNLVDNAIRYSPEARRSLRVTARREGSYVVIDVQDRGIGIAPEELSVVTKKFTRGRMARTDGSGLGLAIVSRIVADHKGTLVLESEVGKGTTAKVYLPVTGD